MDEVQHVLKKLDGIDMEEHLLLLTNEMRYEEMVLDSEREEFIIETMETTSMEMAAVLHELLKTIIIEVEEMQHILIYAMKLEEMEEDLIQIVIIVMTEIQETVMGEVQHEQ